MSITTYLKICIDPYIMVAIVTWTNNSFGVSAALLAIPLFVTEKFNAEPYELGLSLLIIMIPCAITQAVLAKFTQRLGWWKLILVGVSIMPFLFVIYPFVPSFWILSAPNVLTGIGLGSMVMSVLINQYGCTASFISVAIFVLLVNSVVIILRKVPNKQANLSSENVF